MTRTALATPAPPLYVGLVGFCRGLLVILTLGAWAGVRDDGGQPPDDVQPAAAPRPAQARHRWPGAGRREGDLPFPTWLYQDV